MRRTLRLLAITLVCTAALMSFGSVERAAAQQFILQGEGLDCDGTDCALPAGHNLVVDGTASFSGVVAMNADLDVDGHAYLDLLTVETSYWLPECPGGYARDTSVTAYILCEKTLAGGTDRMVKVGDFWVDKYELSAFPNADCTGTQYGTASDNWDMPDNGIWTGASDDAFACSISGMSPSRYLTWFQAQQACTLAGKRLCTNAEWQAAAAGTYDPGSTSTGTQCLVADTAPRATGEAGSTPGATTTCVSAWGADDMIGNVWEWVADWEVAGLDWQTADGASVCPAGCTQATGGWPAGYGDDATWNVDGRAHDGSDWSDGLPAATLRGGAWSNGAGAGVFALNWAYGPSFASDATGVRCCLGWR